MSSTYNKLVDYESKRQEEELKSVEAKKKLTATLKELEKIDRDLLKKNKENKKTKQEIETLRKLLEAEKETKRLKKETKLYTERFLRVAEDKAWYTGTGKDDEILPHQWIGVQFGGVATRWINGDGPGLGKTRQVIGYLDLVNAKKVLIVCEANICEQFTGEAAEYAPHRESFNLSKKTVDKRHTLMNYILGLEEAVIIVNFEIWRRDKDFLAKLLDWEIDTIIVDEAHNLKSTKTANFRNIKTIITADNICANCGNHIKGLYDPEYLKRKPSIKKPMPCTNCGWTIGKPTKVSYGNKLSQYLSTKSIKNVMLTTGTPIINSPDDLYSLLYLCNPVLFKTRESFRRDYLINNYFSGKWEFRGGALDRLEPMIAPFYLARRLEDIGVKLPPQGVHTIAVELEKDEYPKQHRTVEQINSLARIILDSGEKLTIMHLIALITRKRQANVWPGGIVVYNKDGDVIFDAGTEIDESVKMDAIIEKIKKHPNERQIVFSQFKTGLVELDKRLTKLGYRVARLDGSTTESRRVEIKHNFDRRLGEESKWDILLANYKTGGTGLNFSAATVTHILDEEWGPGKRDQSYGRTKRIG